MSEVKTLSANALRERLAARKIGGTASVGKKVKTAAQLEEEEAKIRAVELELEDMARRDKERREAFWRMFRPPDVRGALRRYFADKLKIMLHRLRDKDDRIYQVMDEMLIKKRAEKVMYVRFWMELDYKRKNAVTYDRFCKYFRFPADPWSRRFFDMINVSMSGNLCFLDFLLFCQKFIVVDKMNTMEFSFRMISRRGTTFREKFSVIDLEDMRLYLKYRYKMKNPKELERIALGVFEYVDSDGDGGLFFDEWLEFNEKNWCFVRFSHCYLTHLRKVIFGIKYWVEKTRNLKAKNAKGVNALSFTSRINRKDELWTLQDLKDGVIDGRGRPYITPEWVEQEDQHLNNTESLEQGQKAEADDLAQAVLDKKDDPNTMWEEGDDDLSEGAKAKKAEEMKKLKEDQEQAKAAKSSRKNKAKEAEQRQKARKVVSEKKKEDGKDENKFEVKKHVDKSGRYHQKEDEDEKEKRKKDKGEEVRERRFILVNGKLVEFIEGGINTGKYVDDRKEVAWRGPFSMSNAAKRKFQDDFLDVHIKRLHRQHMRNMKKEAERDASKKIAGRTYKKLVMVCEDLIYARRWIRVGFNRWAEAVGLDRNELMQRSEAELLEGKREAGKKQMAKLLSQSVKQKSLSLIGGKKLSMEEQAEVKRLQEEQRLIAEAIERAKMQERKEEESEYMLHATILKNCKKQEGEIHDEEIAFAEYNQSEKKKMVLPLISGNTYRHVHASSAYDAFLNGDPDLDRLECLADIAKREELKSRSITSFSDKRASRYSSRGSPSRGGKSRGDTRVGTGSPVKLPVAAATHRVSTAQMRRDAGPLEPGAKLPGLTGGFRGLIPHTDVVHVDDLRYGISDMGKKVRTDLETSGEYDLVSMPRANSPPGEASWSVDPEHHDEDIEGIHPDAYYINNQFEVQWYPSYNDPDAPIDWRKSAPEKSYIFDVDKPEGHYDSDSSADL